MSWRILTGDVRTMLQTLPDQSVQCCVTSPPYWGLRDYGTATWEGGDAECDHAPEKRGGRFATPVSSKQASNTGSGTASSRDCPCGARRIDNQIGLEKSPYEFVDNLVQVFSEVRRVLTDDGVLWLNLGDSYATGGGSVGRAPGGGDQGAMFLRQGHINTQPNRMPIDGLKPKDLCGIPWRVAFALQADGWYLRSDVIWAKPNPMPESVTDRPTKAHEYIFLLSKSERYYYDAEAIAEESIHAGKIVQLGPKSLSKGQATARGIEASGNGNVDEVTVSDTRNVRSVWNIATQSYPEAHFATFPEAIPERCIKAGSKVGDTVLDPFCGAGTTGLVADRLERDFIGIELNPAYVTLARKRINEVTPLFPTEETA